MGKGQKHESTRRLPHKIPKYRRKQHTTAGCGDPNPRQQGQRTEAFTVRKSEPVRIGGVKKINTSPTKSTKGNERRVKSDNKPADETCE